MRFTSFPLQKSIRAMKILALAISAPLLLGVPAHAVSEGNQLPDIGTAGLSALSLEKERVIGSQMMMNIRATYPMLYDPALQEYIETLGYRLISKGTTPIHPFHFFLLNDSSINAFAFFGGHVGVHSGLFAAAENESQLASVLAHEIAHVNQRHLARHFEQQMRAQPVTVGATLGAILLTVLAPQAGIAALQTTLAASQQMAINFTRKNEKEADRIGMRTLAAAGFDPYGMPSFFEKLAAKSRFLTKPMAFLMTHPLTETRIADAQLRAHQYPKINYAKNLNFDFARGRVLSRFSKLEPKERVVQFQSKLKESSGTQTEMLSYALALAYLSNQELDAARATLEPLLKKYPRNLFLIDAITDVDLESGKAEQAESRLADFYQYMPENQVIALNYANTLLRQKKPEVAIQVLKEYLLSDSEDITALGLLEEAYDQAGLIGPRYSALADSLALMGQFEQAMAMIDRALTATPIKNRIESAKLEAKKRQLRQELMAMKQRR